MKKMRLLVPIFALLSGGVAAFALWPDTIPGGTNVMLRVRGKSTVADRVAQYGPSVRARLQPDFVRAGVSYPPSKIVLLGLKREKQLQLFASDANAPLRWIKTYPVLAASGHAGPKLREGDLQVPEGDYKIESLNPNSAYHLALRVSYPSDFDREMAQRDGRDTNTLGGNIMIHGSNASIGCLAMGDPASEELFVTVAETKRENVRVLLAPADLRQTSARELLNTSQGSPTWTTKLHQDLERELRKLPLAPKS